MEAPDIPVRPGISSTTLIAAGIKFSDDPEQAGWIEIPYWTRDGDITHFCRWRLPSIQASGQKYHQLKGTDVHVYFPPNFFRRNGSNPFGLAPNSVVFVEGEFKALALLELGIYAIGLPGFNVYHKNKEGYRQLFRDLQVMLHKEGIETIYYLGDADTCTNFEFARNAAFLASAVFPAKVFLPRIPLNGPGKGVDDCKQALGDKFGLFFANLIKGAIPLLRKCKPSQIALLLLEQEETALEALDGIERERHFDRIVDLCAAAKSSDKSQTTARICNLAREVFGITRAELKDALTEQRTHKTEESKNGPPAEGAAGQNGQKPQLILPCPKFEITECAKQCFTVLAKTHRYFTRDRTVFEVVRDEENDGLRLVELEPAAFRSHLEHHFRLVTLRTPSGGGQTFLIENRCSLDNAIALLKSDEAFELLPRIKIVTSAAVFVEVDGKIEVLNEGYHNVKGGILVTRKREITDVDLKVATGALIELLHDFEFVSPADGSRALTGLISPALRLGGLLAADFPLDLSEANESQSGKTYRQKVDCALYGEEPFVLNKNEDTGVGSLDERVSDALISGKPFLMLENVRGAIRSQLLESALRGAGSVQARRAYSRSVQVRPDRICWALSSNKAEATGDLANRSIITRIVKQPSGYQFKAFPEGDLLQHVRANSDRYLSCVLSVVREWHSKGKPRTSDARHDFREWCQSLDWIVQNIFHCAPLLDGHRNEQLRISNPDLNWLREVGLRAEKDNRLSEGLKPAEIVSLCEAHGVDVPRCHASADDTKRRMAVGIILKRLFAEADEIEVGGYLIRRESRDEWNPERREKMIVNYHFFERPKTARLAPIQK